MKQILTLVALSLFFIGIAAAETDEANEVCVDTKCLVATATDCPEKCGPEVSEAAKNVVKFKAGAELSKSVNAAPDNSGECNNREERVHPSCGRNSNGFIDLDSDGDGIPDGVEHGDFPKEWNLPRAEPARGNGNVYCWGDNRRCETSENLEEPKLTGLEKAIDSSNEKAQTSISKRSARTERNPQTGKGIKLAQPDDEVMRILKKRLPGAIE